MEEEDKRNMAAQGGTYLHEIQSEGMSYRTTVWRKCIVQRWSAIEFRWTQRERGNRWTVGWKWGVDRPLRFLTGNRKWHQQLYNSCASERGGGGRKEQSREVGATPQLHQHYCSLPEGGQTQSVLLWVTVPSWLPNSDAPLPTQVLSRSSRYTHKSMDWFIKTIQEKYWVLQD